MKIARILLMPVVAVLITATANAQGPGYPGMGHPGMGGPYGGMPAAYFQPTPAPPINGAAPMPMGPMGPMGAGPMGAGPMDPAGGGQVPMGADTFGNGADMGEFYGEGGVPMDAGGGFVGSNPGGRLPFMQRPLFRQRSGRGYFSAEALMWHRNDSYARVVTIQTPSRVTTPPALVSGLSAPAIRTSDPDFGYETLPRITLGYVLPNDVAIEFAGFYKDDFDATFDKYGDDNLDGVMFGQQPLASRWTSADAQFIDVSTGVHSYEFNIAETNRLFNFMTGLRYVEVRDNLIFRTTKDGLTDIATIGTYNHLFGLHSGVRSHLDWNLFGLDLGAKVGYFVNDAQQRTVQQNTGFAGRDLGRFGGQNDAMIAETKVALTFRPASYMNLRAGYDCLWIVNTALAADQIDEQLSPSANFTGVGINAKGDLFFHGPSVGLELFW
jgi:hypothetical protein